MRSHSEETKDATSIRGENGRMVGENGVRDGVSHGLMGSVSGVRCVGQHFAKRRIEAINSLTTK